MDYLREQGFSSASLWVLEHNPIGRRVYEKLGFMPDGGSLPYRAGDRQLLELRHTRGL
jgi:hypothetical protein